MVGPKWRKQVGRFPKFLMKGGHNFTKEDLFFDVKGCLFQNIVILNFVKIEKDIFEIFL